VIQESTTKWYDVEDITEITDCQYCKIGTDWRYIETIWSQ